MATMNFTISLDAETKSVLERFINALNSCGTPFSAGVVTTPATIQMTETTPTPAAEAEQPEEKKTETPVEEEKVEENPVRVYTAEEIGRAGAVLFDRGVIGTEFFTEVCKSVPITKMNDEQRAAVAHYLIEKGATL